MKPALFALNFALLMLGVVQTSISLEAQKGPTQRLNDFYGLYYADWASDVSDSIALVVGSKGKPIAPKGNDPGAPTQPEFYVGLQHFQFATSRFSAQGFSFRTVPVDGTEFSFQGQFGREQVDSIPKIPYLVGTLKETKNGRVLQMNKVHFAHAVVL